MRRSLERTLGFEVCNPACQPMIVAVGQPCALQSRNEMRLPTLDHDFWTLRSAEHAHHESPDTFWLPPREARVALIVGNAAKLIFDIELEEDGERILQGERMWVIVAERVGEISIGLLDNQPVSFEPNDHTYLRFGAEIPFLAEHVLDIAQPPSEYVEWQLSRAPERRWPRDTD